MCYPICTMTVLRPSCWALKSLVRFAMKGNTMEGHPCVHVWLVPQNKPQEEVLLGPEAPCFSLWSFLPKFSFCLMMLPQILFMISLKKLVFGISSSNRMICEIWNGFQMLLILLLVTLIPMRMRRRTKCISSFSDDVPRAALRATIQVTLYRACYSVNLHCGHWQKCP